MCLEAPNSWIERYFFCQHIVLGIQSYSQMVIRVSNHLRNAIVFWFHYHSQKVIGFLGLFFTKKAEIVQVLSLRAIPGGLEAK